MFNNILNFFNNLKELYIPVDIDKLCDKTLLFLEQAEEEKRKRKKFHRKNLVWLKKLKDYEKRCEAGKVIEIEKKIQNTSNKTKLELKKEINEKGTEANPFTSALAKMRILGGLALDNEKTLSFLGEFDYKKYLKDL